MLDPHTKTKKPNRITSNTRTSIMRFLLENFDAHQLNFFKLWILFLIFNPTLSSTLKSRITGCISIKRRSIINTRDIKIYPFFVHVDFQINRIFIRPYTKIRLKNYMLKLKENYFKVKTFVQSLIRVSYNLKNLEFFILIIIHISMIFILNHPI